MEKNQTDRALRPCLCLSSWAWAANLSHEGSKSTPVRLRGPHASRRNHAARLWSWDMAGDTAEMNGGGIEL